MSYLHLTTTRQVALHRNVMRFTNLDQMGSVLISDATVLTVDGSDTVLPGGWVAFADGRITGVGPKETAPTSVGFDEVISLPGHLVMPGLVNAHTHSAMVLFRGRSEGQSLLTMEGWYNSIREPELSLVRGRHRSGGRALLRRDAALGNYDLLRPVLLRRGDRRGRFLKRHARRHRLRHRSARRRRARRRRAGEGRSLYRAPALRRRPHRSLARTARALRRQFRGAAASRSSARREIRRAACICTWPPVPRTTRRRWRGTALPRRKRWRTTASSPAACMPPIASISPTTTSASSPRRRAASVAHCATAGLRSGREGICPVVKLREAGVVVALGTDNVAANNSYDMIAEMRVAGPCRLAPRGQGPADLQQGAAPHGDHRRRPCARPRS